VTTDLEKRRAIEQHWAASELEFCDGLVTHETQYFADPFEAPAARARLARRLDPGS
jgi:hypothetical protein